MDRLARYANSLLEGSQFFMESTGALDVIGTGDASLEQRLQSSSEVDDTHGLTTLLQKILVIDPQRRPDVSDLLNHSWFVDPSDPPTPSGSASE